MSDTSPVEMTHDLGHYLRPMRRHLRLITFFVIGGLVVGLAAAIVKKPTYMASSKVYVVPDLIDLAGVNSTTSRTSGAVNMDSEAQFATSLATATAASKLLGNGASPSTLLARLSVTVPPNTQILKISYSAHSTAAAIAGANALANAYLQNRQAAAEAYQSDRLQSLEKRRSAAQDQLVQDQVAYGDATPHTSAAKRLANAIGNDQNAIAGLNAQIQPVQGGSTIPGNVTSEAVLGGSSPNQGRLMYMLGGLVLGVLLGIAAAAARERFDKTVRYEDDLARNGVRLLAEIPPSKRRGKATEAEALARSRVVQRMAAAIGVALGDGGGSIYLAELSRVAMNDRIDEQLAAELSRFGSTTEIVTLGASPVLQRKPARHEQVVEASVEPEPEPQPEALTAASNGSANHDVDPSELITQDYYATNEMLGWPMPSSALGVVDVPQVVDIPKLAPAPEPVVEVAKPEPPPVPVESPEERFDATTALLHQVQAGLGRARYVILTGADTPQGSEAYVLASLSQVTVIVVETGVTERSRLSEVVEQIDITPSRILGGLLWRPWPKDAGTRPFGSSSRPKRAASQHDRKNVVPAKDRKTASKSR